MSLRLVGPVGALVCSIPGFPANQLRVAGVQVNALEGSLGPVLEDRDPRSPLLRVPRPALIDAAR